MIIEIIKWYSIVLISFNCICHFIKSIVDDDIAHVWEFLLILPLLIYLIIK